MPAASIIIPTKNRREDLRKALASCTTQDADVEVVVADDGSTDGTSEMVRTEFPRVILLRNEQSVGSCINRNRAVERASGAYIFSIDDDCAFISPRTVAQTIADFSHPRVGAVAIPFNNVNNPPVERQRGAVAGARGGDIRITSSFRGCAAAWRRDLFRAVGGYSPVIGHGVEEPELCLRFLGLGFVTRLGSADPLEHYESPKRDKRHIAYLYGRNHVLMGWMDVPMPDLMLYLPGNAAQLLRARFGMEGQRGQIARGLLKGYSEVLGGKVPREPIASGAWRAMRATKHKSDACLADLEPHLPDLPSALPPRMEASLGDRALAGGTWSTH